MLISFFLFLTLFLLVGIASVIKNRHTTIDYLVATHSESPFVVATSAVATNNSGYMFIGMIGFTYSFGLMSIWLAIGWVIGDFLISFVVHRHLREVSAKSDVYSYAGVLSDWYGRPFRTLRKLAGGITLIFLGTYAAAQLKAGSKALHVLFGFHESIGALLGGGIVLAYCFVGGIRASFWTDVVQSFVMWIAMGLLLTVGLETAGGFDQAFQQLSAISPTYMSLFPHDLPLGPYLGPLLFLGGWLFAGFSVVGQPHIMVRFMALDDPKHMWICRLVYYGFYVTFYALTICVGLLTRILLTTKGEFDPELALPLLAIELLPGALSGMVLAGIFAATMSTADSQILACTATITGDFTKEHVTNYFVTKMATVAVMIVALSIALGASDNVFNLVVFSWGALGSAFVPVIVLYSLGRKLSEKLSVAMCLTGLAAAILFRTFFSSLMIFEALPGVLAGFVPYIIFRRKTSA